MLGNSMMSNYLIELAFLEFAQLLMIGYDILFLNQTVVECS